MSRFSSLTALFLIAHSAISIASAEVMLTVDFEKIDGPTGAIPFFYKHTTTETSISGLEWVYPPGTRHPCDR